MRPIETRWKGYRFRSRTEARWAVFFDALGISFEYEPEGVILPSGPYLPDFRFRTFDQISLWEQDNPEFNLNFWLEVKGSSPTDEELTKCLELAQESHEFVYLAVGAPDVRPQLHVISPYCENLEMQRGADRINGLALFAQCSDRGGLALSYPDARRPQDPETGESYAACTQSWLENLRVAEAYPTTRGWWHPVIGPDMQRAYDAARSARFEFGETDQRWS